MTTLAGTSVASGVTGPQALSTMATIATTIVICRILRFYISFLLVSVDSENLYSDILYKKRCTSVSGLALYIFVLLT